MPPHNEGPLMWWLVKERGNDKKISFQLLIFPTEKIPRSQGKNSYGLIILLDKLFFFVLTIVWLFVQTPKISSRQYSDDARDSTMPLQAPMLGSSLILVRFLLIAVQPRGC